MLGSRFDRTDDRPSSDDEDSLSGTTEITFPNGNRALLATPEDDRTPAETLEALGIRAPSALLLVIGGAGGLDSDLQPRLVHLFTLGVVRAVSDAEAVMIDGGTDAGVMAILGRVAAEQQPRPVLLGVAPKGKVSYARGPDGDDRSPLEPHHSHFAIAPGTRWGSETDLLIGLASEVAGDRPAVGLVVGGGRISRREARQAVRKGWPLVVLEGSGGVADEIAEAVRRRRAPIDDPVLAEIVEDGDIDLFPVDGDGLAMRGVLGGRLKEDHTLRMAWTQFAMLDAGAKDHQRTFRRQRVAILSLGVLGTALALTQTSLDMTDVLEEGIPWLVGPLRYTIIAIPIVVAALVAGAARFRPGSRWVVLRGTAEAIKGEIYRYRAAAGLHARGPKRDTSRPVKLAEIVGSLTGALMHTDVNLTSLDEYDGPIPPPGAAAPGDDGMSHLSPERYIEHRIDDQVAYYRTTASRLERKLRRLRWGILVAGALGTFLAAVGLELWIALTLAVAAALTSYLESGQVENSLMHANQAATDLIAIRSWWMALPPGAQRRQANVDRLVEQAERIMRSEQSGWVQEMQDVIARLRMEEDPAGMRKPEEPRDEQPPRHEDSTGSDPRASEEEEEEERTP